eukprot:gene10065-7959_t
MSFVTNPLDNHPEYEKVGNLGTGSKSFSDVARVKGTDELVAIKFIPRGWDKSQSRYIIRELVNLQELSLSHHPHVIEFKDAFLTRHYLAQVGEYVEGSTLQVFLESAGGKVIEALGQLPLLKLCDFGFCKDTFRDSQACSQVGTALYTAPEVMQNFSEDAYDGKAVDIWACGIVLAIMIFGRHPFLRTKDEELNQSQQLIKLFQRVIAKEAEFPEEVLADLSPSCLDLIKEMLEIDPVKRIDMEGILSHPWFLEALPPGAATMNSMFIADTSTILSAEAQMEIEALVHQASLPERSRVDAVQQRQLQQLEQHRRQKRHHQQKELEQQIEQQHRLEDMVMNMPTSELLHAATVDLRSPLTVSTSLPASCPSGELQVQGSRKISPDSSSGESGISDASQHEGFPAYNFMFHDADVEHSQLVEHSPLGDISSLGVDSQEEWATFGSHRPHGADAHGRGGRGGLCPAGQSPQARGEATPCWSQSASARGLEPAALGSKGKTEASLKGNGNGRETADAPTPIRSHLRRKESEKVVEKILPTVLIPKSPRQKSRALERDREEA